MSKITLNELKTIDLKKLKRVDLAGLIYDLDTLYLNKKRKCNKKEWVKRSLNGVGCVKGWLKAELIEIVSRKIIEALEMNKTEKTEAVQENTIFKVKKIFNKINNDGTKFQLVLMVDKNGNELITYGTYIWKATIERLEQLQEISMDKFDKNRFMKYWLKLHDENMIDFSEVESVQDETLKELLSGDDSFKYMMLDRLIGDCKYYLGYGNRCSKHLWAKDEHKQIKYIKALYNSFSEDEKPNFITMEDINQLEKEMTK